MSILLKIFIGVAIAAVIVTLVTSVVFASTFGRSGYESPTYEIVRKDESIEIRRYQSLSIVTTPMKSADPNEEGSFMRLFRYISKKNDAQQKIAMTTPVFMLDDEEGKEMAFIVPADVAAQGAPAPSAKNVKLDSFPGGTFAAIRYNGSWKPSRAREHEEQLLEWVSQQGYTMEGEAIIAYYDPPFTPSILRRNEVLVRLTPDQDFLKK